MKVFILEDDEARIKQFLTNLLVHDVVVARSMEEATSLYKPGVFDLLLLDHDLGGQVYVSSLDPTTGAAFCRWLRLIHPEPEPSIGTIVHSLNPVGTKEMRLILQNDLKWVRVGAQAYSSSLLAWLHSRLVDYKGY